MKDFNEKDLLGDLGQGESVEEGGEDVLGKINNVLGNIDTLLTHIVDIKEKHPELLAKFAQLQGGDRFGAIYRGQYSPTQQPQVEGKVIKQVSADKLYTLLLGMLHQLEGKNLTIEQAKQLCIQNKVAIIAQLKEAIPSLVE